MAKLELRGKDLRQIGYPEGPVISIAKNIMQREFKYSTKEEVMELLQKILKAPVEYENDAVLGLIALQLIPKETIAANVIELNKTGVPVNIFGSGAIEQQALTQMDQAARLPVSVSGALMPDAHSGYGLPIGGVLATSNAVIPYGVGVDIGCRMCLSVFDIDPKTLVQREQYFTTVLNENTLFGSGQQFLKSADHEVLDSPLFDEIAVLKQLQNKAAMQLGSSGSGNHFVEFGIVAIKEKDEVLKLEAGTYLGLLSHSGSRGLGASIAGHYTKLAKEKRLLPKEAANLAWLDMNEEEGIEYWLAMNLAGDYASACHHAIHAKVAKQLGRQPITMVENHHNFAWKEMVYGPEGGLQELIVHRKGATPAGKDVLGIIPGSMTAPGFIVKGKGEVSSLASASHGAGRKMSRTAALNSITQNALNELLAKHGVKLIGGGLDEAPHAYKNIEEVMKAQQHLVDTVGIFYPKIVKMDGTAPKPWMKRAGE
ncbi:RtcB family protein [Pseudoflavitalea rhizosphaerae]|uniref:RtcB family protein n=1 Tax=Pseudoflavitalea rhizosphaerae TaxID=1884793 RepID=UPI000F8F7EF2|nr:RtcB family protein [Pseudoflavitalea rhizosphaerae]